MYKNKNDLRKLNILKQKFHYEKLCSFSPYSLGMLREETDKCVHLIILYKVIFFFVNSSSLYKLQIGLIYFYYHCKTLLHVCLITSHYIDICRCKDF